MPLTAEMLGKVEGMSGIVSVEPKTTTTDQTATAICDTVDNIIQQL